MIVSDLIKDCPHEQMRVAAIGLLRELLVTKFTQVGKLHSTLSEQQTLINFEI